MATNQFFGKLHLYREEKELSMMALAIGVRHLQQQDRETYSDEFCDKLGAKVAFDAELNKGELDAILKAFNFVDEVSSKQLKEGDFNDDEKKDARERLGILRDVIIKVEKASDPP